VASIHTHILANNAGIFHEAKAPTVHATHIDLEYCHTHCFVALSTVNHTSKAFKSLLIHGAIFSNLDSFSSFHALVRFLILLLALSLIVPSELNQSFLSCLTSSISG
jgi:hypothetical protein